MATLWTFGCSFTAEYHPVGWDNIVSNYDLYKEFRGGNLPSVWPIILGEKLGMDVKNLAIGGSSNYSIAFQFLEVCEQIKPDDIVIFGWTQILRFIAANMDQEILNDILPSENIYSSNGLSKNTTDEIFVNRTNPLWKKEVHYWIKFINLYFEKIGGNVFHWTSDDMVFTTYDSICTNDKRFVFSDNEEFTNTHRSDLYGYLVNPINYGGKNIAQIIGETNGIINDGHMGEAGHKFTADFFYNYIIKNV